MDQLERRKTRFENKHELEASEPLRKALQAAYDNDDAGYGVGKTYSFESSPRLSENSDADAARGNTSLLDESSGVRQRHVRSASVTAEEKYAHHGGSFEAYIVTKRAKLVEQNQARGTALRGDAISSSLFSGLVIFVDGHTRNLPTSRLQDLVIRHGGKVENTFSTAVTHVVCENLAGSKLRRLLEAKRALKRSIVLPNWVLDSVEAGQLARECDYAIVNTNPNVAKIDDLLKRDSPAYSAVESKQPSLGSSDRDPRSMSRIDRDVWNDLPSTIRRECEERIRLKKGRQSSGSQVADSLAYPRVDNSSAIPLFSPTTCAFNCVADALVIWMHKARKPNDKHAVLLVELIAVNVTAGRLDDVGCLLRLIDDVAQRELASWKKVVNLVWDLAQHMIREARGGARLIVRSWDEDRQHPDTYFLDR